MKASVAALCVLGLAILGCASSKSGYRANLDATQLAASEAPHKLIVPYLAQTSADAGVCDLQRRDGEAISYADGRLVKALGRGFEDGVVRPGQWRGCMEALYRSEEPGLTEALDRSLLSLTRGFAKQPGRERDYGEALVDVLVGRPAAEPIRVDRALASVRSAMQSTSEREPRFAVLEDLASALEVEVGLFEGTAVDRGRIRSERSERVLESWARRLPDAGLRRAAGEQLVQRRIDRSSHPWVKANAQEVLTKALQGPVRVNEPVVHAVKWTPTAEGAAMLRLLQDPTTFKAWLHPAGRDGTRTGDPSVDLKGSLWLTVEGFDAPLTLCGQERFQPEPCVSPREVTLTHPLAVLDPSGRVIFPRRLGMREFIELGAEGERLRAQLVVGGAIGRLDMPIQFESVPEYRRVEHDFGTPIRVRVFELSNRRLLLEILDRKNKKKPWTKTWAALVESDDMAFSLVNEVYTDRNDIVARSGNVVVTMHCTNCPEVRSTLKRMIKTRGMADGKVIIKRAKK